MRIFANKSGFTLVNRSTPTFTKGFWDSMWSPMSRRRILMEIMSSGGFSTGPHHQNHPAVIKRILDSGGVAAIFAGLEFARLFYLTHLQAQVQATPYTNVTIITAECDHHYRGMRPPSGRIIHKTCCSFCCRLQAITKKNKV